MASSPDWARFGLDDRQKDEKRKSEVQQDEKQYQRCQEELFAQEEGPAHPSPWWQVRPWFSRGGSLSWWDGAMATAALATLGALVWVRGGWAVGTVGLSGALGVMTVCLCLGTAAVFSASALLSRLLRTADASDYYGSSSATGGAVYSLLSHSLGPIAAAAPAMLYCLAHVASCALHLRLFAEASTDVVLSSSTPVQTREWVEKGVAIASLAVVALTNMAGVRRVAQLQLALLALLALALLDLLIGAGQHWSSRNLRDNWRVHHQDNDDDSSFLERWKNVFRVLFPALGGAVAAANLGADLKRPQRDVPLGATVATGIAAVVASTLLLALAASSTRAHLLQDPLVAAHVSALGVVFLSGVYLSSLSSGLTALLAAPRVLQAVAAEDLLRPLRPLAKARGSSQVPILALCLTTMVALSLILVGGVTDLAPVATLAMLLSQAALHLAYFLLASAEEYDDGPEDDDLLTPSMAAAVTPSSSSLLSSPDDHSSIQDDAPSEMHALLAPPTATSPSSASSHEPYQPKQRYCCGWRLWNRWLALLAGVANVALAMLAQWVLALGLLLGAMVLWLVLRALAPASRPGAASLALKRRHQHHPSSTTSKKSLLRSAAAALLGRAKYNDPDGGHHTDTVVLTSAPPEPQVAPPQVVTRENQDFASRKPFHRATLLQE